MEGKHYVLVHGAGHGAWCWFKLKPKLESSGNKVTALDLAASGIHPKRIQDVATFAEYCEPLLDLLGSLPESEKVVLVGHSFGGMCISLAMEKFPRKIALAVYIAAFAPDTQHPPSYVMEQFFERNYPNGNGLLDAELLPNGSMTYGPNFISEKLYQLCSTEDLELANSLARPACLFLEELSKAESFSKEGYGSVPAAYIVCNEDLAIQKEFQKWIIQNACIDKVIEIVDVDHMVMLCKPHQLLLALLDLANNYT